MAGKVPFLQAFEREKYGWNRHTSDLCTVLPTFHHFELPLFEDFINPKAAIERYRTRFFRQAPLYADQHEYGIHILREPGLDWVDW